MTKELEDEPRVRAALMETMGRSYGLLGLQESAEPLLGRSGDAGRCRERAGQG